MTYIYHEKQDAALCGLHCINNILQGPFFDVGILSEIAQNIDLQEKVIMAENGFDSEDYIKYISEESSNISDSGDYSIQVLSEALKTLNLNVSPVKKSNQLRSIDYTKEQAFICNHKNHWIAIRKINFSWWNLDSFNKKPQKLSDIHLEALLEQLVKSNYTIFTVKGEFPVPIVEGDNWNCFEDEDHELNEAILLSLKENNNNVINLDEEEEDEDEELKMAIELSKTINQKNEESVTNSM